MSIQYKVLDTYKNAHDEEIWDVVWQDDNTILTASLDDNVKHGLEIVTILLNLALCKIYRESCFLFR